MSAQPVPGVPARAGHTRIATEALAGMARAVAGDAFGVDAAAVRVELDDEFGVLSLSLALPLPLEDDGGATVWDRARDRRAEVMERFAGLTGVRVGRVDLRVTGVAAAARRRVR